VRLNRSAFRRMPINFEQNIQMVKGGFKIKFGGCSYESRFKDLKV
jgi:hypothetical protein